MKRVVIFIMLTILLAGCSSLQVAKPEYVDQIINEKNREIERVREFYTKHINDCIDIYNQKYQSPHNYDFLFIKNKNKICIEDKHFIIFINLLDGEDNNIKGLIKCLKFE